MSIDGVYRRVYNMSLEMPYENRQFSLHTLKQKFLKISFNKILYSRKKEEFFQKTIGAVKVLIAAFSVMRASVLIGPGLLILPNKP